MSDHEADLLAEAEQRIGSVLVGKWTLDRVLGVGGMATVYSAVHRAGAPVAIKVLHTGLVSHPEALARFKREAYIANKVEHPGVVKVLDDDVTTAGEPFLVMELLHGESIEQRAERVGGKLPLAEVLSIAERTLGVLEAAHAKGIVHRDLKPDNVFLTTDGQLKVLDFGIARLREADVKKTRTGMMLGTPAFMAPEQALGQTDDIDARTDLWSLGAMMFTLLTGRMVHEADTSSLMLVYASTNAAPSVARFATLPTPVVRLIDQALEFDPSRRFQSASSMRAAVREAMVALGRRSPSVAPSAQGPVAPSVRPRPLARTEAEMPESPDLDLPLDRPKDSAPPPRASVRPAGSNRPGASDEAGLDVSFAATDTGALIELFTLLEGALFAASQYGFDHPETARRIDASLERCLEGLRASEAGLAWNVAPYGFTVGGKPLWEPRTPLDRIPYQLFSDGVRSMGLVPGLDANEFGRFVRIIAADRARDMAPEDDLVTLLWQAGFDHVAYQVIDTFADGDQAERAKFETETKQVVALANFDTSFQLEDCWHDRDTAPAAAIDERERRISAMLAGEREGTAETANALAARMRGDTRLLGDRFVLAASLAWADAAATKTTAAIVAPLRSAIDSLCASTPAGAIELISSLCSAFDRTVREPRQAEYLRATLVGAVVSPATMKRLFEGSLAAGENVAVFARALNSILSYVDDSHVAVAIETLPRLADPTLTEAVLGYLGRAGRGHEPRMAAAFAEADLEVGLALIRVLARIGSPEARNALMRASTSPHAVVRIEALGHVEGVASERVRLELKALLEDPEPNVRAAALRAMQHHHIRAAGPGLVLRIRSAEFDKLTVDEKRLTLETLVTLAPNRAEAVCLELLEKARVVSSEAHEHTRAIAAELLGRVGSSPEVLDALDEASSARWRNSERVRQTAARAKNYMELRLSQPPPAAPAISVPPIHTVPPRTNPPTGRKP